MHVPQDLGIAAAALKAAGAAIVARAMSRVVLSHYVLGPTARCARAGFDAVLCFLLLNCFFFVFYSDVPPARPHIAKQTRHKVATAIFL